MCVCTDFQLSLWYVAVITVISYYVNYGQMPGSICLLFTPVVGTDQLDSPYTQYWLGLYTMLTLLRIAFLFSGLCSYDKPLNGLKGAFSL